MKPQETPKTAQEIIAALADGELDLREHPEALDKLAADPHVGQAAGQTTGQVAEQIAYQQQLKRAVASAMDTPKMCCPEALRASLTAAARMNSPEAASSEAYSSEASAPAQARSLEALTQTPAQVPARAQAPDPATRHRQPPTILARIGHWAPTAVAAVLLIAATAVFISRPGNPGLSPTPSHLSIAQIKAFGGRHMHCAENPSGMLVEHDRFGQDLAALPGSLDDYFQRSAGGLSLDLSTIQYDYQLAGVCNLPGEGGIHIVYRRHDDPDRAMSLWIIPASQPWAQDLDPGRVYVETGIDLDHPVILWEDGGLLFYLVGDSLDDVQQAVDELRQDA